MRPLWESYFAQMSEVSRQLMRIFAVALSLDIDYFEDKINDDTVQIGGQSAGQSVVDRVPGKTTRASPGAAGTPAGAAGGVWAEAGAATNRRVSPAAAVILRIAASVAHGSSLTEEFGYPSPVTETNDSPHPAKSPRPPRAATARAANHSRRGFLYTHEHKVSSKLVSAGLGLSRPSASCRIKRTDTISRWPLISGTSISLCVRRTRISW